MFLKEPSIEDELSYIQMRKEWKQKESNLVPDLLNQKCDNKQGYCMLLEKICNIRNGIHEDTDWYHKAYYYLVIEEETIIGMVCVRSGLTELGRTTWGHIAYGIRPSQRRKGYGSKVVKLLLEKCRQLNISPVIACHYLENKVSQRVLESVGAKLEAEIKSEYSGKTIKRYHIEL